MDTTPPRTGRGRTDVRGCSAPRLRGWRLVVVARTADDPALRAERIENLGGDDGRPPETKRSSSRRRTLRRAGRQRAAACGARDGEETRKRRSSRGSLFGSGSVFAGAVYCRRPVVTRRLWRSGPPASPTRNRARVDHRDASPAAAPADSALHMELIYFGLSCRCHVNLFDNRSKEDISKVFRLDDLLRNE